MVRAVGLEPTQALRLNGFSYHFGFRRRPIWAFVSGPSHHHGVAALGAARPVSTHSRLGAWLGITSEGFPDLGSFTPAISRRALHCLSPVRLPLRHEPMRHFERIRAPYAGDL